MYWPSRDCCLDVVCCCNPAFHHHPHLHIPFGRILAELTHISHSYPACDDVKNKLFKKPDQEYAKVFEPSLLDSVSKHALGDSAVLNNLDSWALRDAPICPSAYDLIMISPPVGGQRQVYTEIASQLASLGFLVVTVDHPSLSGAVAMSDGSLIYNMAGEVIQYREAELIQLANLKVIMDNLSNDELSGFSPLLTQEALVNANTSCVLGHGLGGQVSMLMVANGIVSCGMVLDDRMPMPGPFSEENTPVSPMQTEDPPVFVPGEDQANLETVHPYPQEIIEDGLPQSPVLRKMLAIAKGAAEYAALGIFKLVCFITNQDCFEDEHLEKRSLSGGVVSDDRELAIPLPKDHGYGNRQSYDYSQPPIEYEDPFDPQPAEDENPEPIWPPPGVFPPGVVPPPPPPPPNNNTNDTNPPPPPPPPQVPSYPPPHVCGPNCCHPVGPEPCCHPPHGYVDTPCPDEGEDEKDDDEHWEYDWGNCDDDDDEEEEEEEGCDDDDSEGLQENEDGDDGDAYGEGADDGDVNEDEDDEGNGEEYEDGEGEVYDGNDVDDEEDQ